MKNKKDIVLAILLIIVLGLMGFIIFNHNKKVITGITYNYHQTSGDDNSYFQRQLFMTDENKCWFYASDFTDGKQNNVIAKHVDIDYCDKLAKIIKNNYLEELNNANEEAYENSKDGLALSILYVNENSHNVYITKDNFNNYENTFNELNKLFLSIK